MRRCDIEERVKQEAKYIVDGHDTLRSASRVFGVSKTTVYNDMTEKLPCIDKQAADAVSAVFIGHRREKIRGGNHRCLKRPDRE